MKNMEQQHVYEGFEKLIVCSSLFLSYVKHSSSASALIELFSAI